MAFNYAGIADIVLTQLTELGQDVTRVAYSTDMYAELDGEVGGNISTPDSAANRIIGGIDIRFRIAAFDWSPVGDRYPISKIGVAGQRAYDIQLRPSKTFTLRWSENGTDLFIKDSLSSIPVSDGEILWGRITLDVDNGAGGNDVKFFTSTDDVNDSEDVTTWPQLGTTITTAGTTSIFAGTQRLVVGGQSAGTGIFAGKIKRIQIYDGIDGTLAVDYNANDYDTGLTQTSSTTSEVWTYNGGVIVPGYNPATGIAPLRTDSTTRKGAIFSFGEKETYVRGQQVKVADKRLLVDAEAGVNLKDHFIVDSVEYTIVSVDEVSPAGTVVLYDLHIRAG